jgi:putative ABC transport system permease protein
MRFIDVVQFASGSLSGSRTRTWLMILAMSIGVASVLILTALGEGARLYVVNQFSSLGTNLVLVFPGRTETAGIGPGMLLGQIPRELSLEDADALLKSRAVKRIAPLTIGSSQISRDALNRDVIVLGSTSDLLEVRHMSLALGQFLPAGNTGESVCVLGAKIRRELFGKESAIGA